MTGASKPRGRTAASAAVTAFASFARLTHCSPTCRSVAPAPLGTDERHRDAPASSTTHSRFVVTAVVTRPGVDASISSTALYIESPWAHLEAPLRRDFR